MKKEPINHYPLFQKSLENITGVKWFHEYHIWKDSKKGSRPLRADLANPDLKIAIEIEGGIFSKNIGHSSVKGILRDIAKNNRYVLEGWKLIRLIPSELMTSETFNMVKKVCEISIKK